MKFNTVLTTVALLCASKSLAMTWEEADAKAREWVADLTNEEKITLTTGRENMQGVCVGSIDPIERKGFKGLCLQDGPAGVRFGKGSATSWQAAINTAATFDRTLLRKVGEAQGNEFYQRGINAALAPTLNIQRAPAAGRIWEGFGEDPYYVGQCGVEVVKGMQSQGIMATPKHFVGNDQEMNRGSSSSNIPEQALWEVYMDPFIRVVNDASTDSIMSSYNAINGTYSVQNKKILTDYLKDKIGFQGFIMSDWWSVFDGDKSFASGLDMNMPGGKYWGPNYIGDSFWGEHIQENIDAGILTQERLDDAALRIVRSLFKAGQMEDYPEVNLYVDTLTEENKALNRKVAADSNVLLKNDAILPIKGAKKIAVIGKDALPTTFCEDNKCVEGTVALGWGSGTTDFRYIVDPLSAIAKRAEQENIEIVGYGEDDAEGGANAAKDADLAIVFVQADSGEEYITVEGSRGDRVDLDVWHHGNELIDAVASVNENTIVVIHAPGPVNVPFLNKVKGIVFAGMPGQESGNALVDVLFGDVNPSGHLPYTWAPREDYPADVKYDPKLQKGGEEKIQYDYDEGLFVGYRWFDKKGIKPTFPFGFGLSYTTFDFSDLEAEMKEDGVHVTLTVTNTGDVAGAAVPMIFVSFPESVKDYPVRLFKGFDKLMLQPGESKETTILIDNHDLSYFDVESMEFVKPKDGEYTIYAGSNAGDLPLKVNVSAEEENTNEVEDITADVTNDEDSADDSVDEQESEEGVNCDDVEVDDEEDSDDEQEVENGDDVEVDDEEDSTDEEETDSLQKRAYKYY